MRKTFMLIVIFSLLFVSCNPQPTNPPSQNKEFIPGKSTLPEKPEGDKNYYLVNISKDVLSTPVESEITTTTTSGIVEGNSQSIEISKARLTTDINGVAVVADSKAGGFVPIIVLDENQKPLEGIRISYECFGDRVILVIYDPNGKYDPQIITVNVADLYAGISRGDGSYSVGEMASLIFPLSSIPTVSPGKDLLLNGVIAVLPFAAKVWGDVGIITNAVTFGFSLPQLVGASQGQPYFCIPPGFWSSPLIQAADIAIAFIAPEEKGIEIVAAKFITAYLVSRGIESVFDQPVLFKVLTFDQSTMDMIIHDAGHVSNAIKILSATFQPADPDVGKCVFAPDLSQLTVTEARKTLGDMGIQPKDYDVVCPEGYTTCEDGNVYSQTPVPNTEVTPLPLITIPIPSCLAIFANGDVRPRMRLNIYYMVLKPPEPLPPAETEPPPTMNLFGQIAFESDRSGQSEVYILNVQTKQVTQLTFNSISSGQPNWSPDGKILAFASTLDATSLNRGIFVMPIFPQLGSAQLINGNRAWAPKWSPDGRHIGYISDRSNTVLGSRMFIMNPDGSDDRYLSPSNVYGYEGDITWSPDVKEIYFTAGASGHGQFISTFCVTSVDSYNPICPPPNFSKDVINLNWSPNGKEAIFSMQGEIYKINSDGNGLTRLTETGMEFLPVWSPDGQYIAFVSNRDGNQEIYVMDANGKNEINVTNNPANDSFPDWSAVSFEEPIECQGSLETRLQIGDKVYVSYRPPLPNRLRAEPNLSAKILDLMQPGTVLDILDGFACGGGFRFWKVKESNGMIGWTAEGDLMNYWLVPGNPPAEATLTEAQIRYVLADIQLGGVDNYYRQFLDQPAIAEAIRRWDAGVRVVNISRFERKIVGSWMVVYAGTVDQINGLDVVLSTDTPGGSSTCALAGITNPTFSTNISNSWLSENNELGRNYDYSNGGQVTFLHPGVRLTAGQDQTAFISFQPYWGTLAVKLVNQKAYKIALLPVGSGTSWTDITQNGSIYMVFDVDNSAEPSAGLYYKMSWDQPLTLLNNRWDMVSGEEYTVVFDLSPGWFKLFDKNGKLVIDYDLSGFWGPKYTGHMGMADFPWWTIGAGWTDTSYPTDLLIEEVCYEGFGLR